MGWGGVTLPGQGIPGVNGAPGTVQGTGDFLTQLVSQFGPQAAQAVAAYIQQQQQNDAKNYIGGVGTTATGALNAGKTQGDSAFGQQSDALSGILSGSNPWMQQLSQGLLPNIATLNNQLPSLVQGQNQNLGQFQGLPANQVYQDPNAAAALKGIGSLNDNTGGLLNWASQMINSGGITNTQVPLGQYSQSLMSGQNPQQQALATAGGKALDSGGMTPQLQAALQQAMGVVQGGGATPLTNQLAQRGLDLSGTNPLLSMGQVASFTQDQAGRNYKQAANTAREQAQLRGQGPGSVVASGVGNQALADNSDAALSGTSQAMTQALQGQQGLNLQQLSAGLNAGLSAADIQRSLELGGLGSVAGLTQAGTGLLGTGGSLTEGALAGSNAGAGQYAGLLGLQQSNLQQGLNTGFSGIGAQQGVNQTYLQDLLQGQTGQANLGSMLANLYLQNQGQYGQAIGQGIGANTTATGQLGQQGGQYLGFGQAGLGTLGSTAGDMAQLFRTPNATSTYLNNLGGGGTSPIKVNVQTPPILGTGGYPTGGGYFGGYQDPFAGDGGTYGGGAWDNGSVYDYSDQKAARPSTGPAPQTPAVNRSRVASQALGASQ